MDHTDRVAVFRFVLSRVGAACPCRSAFIFGNSLSGIPGRRRDFFGENGRRETRIMMAACRPPKAVAGR
jgi:hypothetical protein